MCENSPEKLPLHSEILMHRIHHFLDFFAREMHNLPRILFTNPNGFIRIKEWKSLEENNKVLIK